MDYVILLKTVLENNTVANIIQRIPHTGDIELATMYKYCECRCIDVKNINTSFLDNMKNIVVIFDEEFLLKSGDIYANEIASVLYGYLEHGECLCGNVMLCKTTDDGDCVPFEEKEADRIMKLLYELEWLIQANDIEFKVQQPKMFFRAF